MIETSFECGTVPVKATAVPVVGRTLIIVEQKSYSRVTSEYMEAVSES